MGAKPMKVWEAVRDKIQKRIRILYLFWGAFIAISCCFVWSATSGHQGLLRLLQLKESLQLMENENTGLIERSHALEKEIYLLKNDSRHVEKIAREDYGYIANGETLYQFHESDSGP